jgi:hypothetical protein
MQALATLAVATSPASAQSNSTKDTIGALGNLFGSMAKAGAKSKALKQWQAQDAQVIQCINTIYSSKNLTADSFVAAGVGPNDPTMAPVINLCKVVMTTPPKTNFPCNVTNTNGQQVASTCSESYAATRNGSLVAISRDDFLRAAGNSEQVQLANFETAEANAARIRVEQQQAAVERQRFLASPEGKRQAAAEAARAKQAEIERRRAEAARAAQEAQRPRGYALVCSGKNLSQRENLNKIYVNCNNPQDAITKMSWAYNKISTEKYMPGGESFASMCLSQINQLRGMMGNTRYTGPIGDISSYNFLDVCNTGLQRVSGPSEAQARPRK